jgi:hypothetical protein
MNDDSTNLLVRGAEGPNSQLVSGHGVSLHLGTHLRCLEPVRYRGWPPDGPGHRMGHPTITKKSIHSTQPPTTLPP